MGKQLEEEMYEVEQAPDKGLKVSEVLQKGESPMKVSSIENNERVFIYDTLTGEQSLCLRYMLPQQLKKKRPDGSRVFTTVKPNIEVKRGIIKCLLHIEDSNREHYDELGLPVCGKSNLTNLHQVRMHMKKRHKEAWEVIEEERIEKEKDSERRMMAKLLKRK